MIFFFPGRCLLIQVTRGWNAGDMALVFVSIICIGIIGALLAFVLNKLEKVVCPWNR